VFADHDVRPTCNRSCPWVASARQKKVAKAALFLASDDRVLSLELSYSSTADRLRSEALITLEIEASRRAPRCARFSFSGPQHILVHLPP